MFQPSCPMLLFHAVHQRVCGIHASVAAKCVHRRQLISCKEECVKALLMLHLFFQLCFLCCVKPTIHWSSDNLENLQRSTRRAHWHMLCQTTLSASTSGITRLKSSHSLENVECITSITDSVCHVPSLNFYILKSETTFFPTLPDLKSFELKQFLVITDSP